VKQRTIFNRLSVARLALSGLAALLMMTMASCMTMTQQSFDDCKFDEYSDFWLSVGMLRCGDKVANVTGSSPSTMISSAGQAALFSAGLPVALSQIVTPAASTVVNNKVK
jgi:hypothetical protein